MPRQAKLKSFLVECFWPNVRSEDVERGAERVRCSAEELRLEGVAVRLAGSIHVEDDDVVFYLVDGRSVETVRSACERAGLRYERVVASVRRGLRSDIKEER